MNKFSFSKIALTTSLLMLGSATLASAAGTSNCQIIYGGGEVCNQNVSFTVDKKVQAPTKGGEMVDNLSVNDAKFGANQNVTFQITLKNTGDKTVNLNVSDILPSYLIYVSGGTYDSNAKKVTNTVSLNPNDSKTFTIVAKVVDEGSLPNQSVTCVTNVSRATNDNGASAEDNAQFCIQKGATIQSVVPAKSIPNTGPEALILFALPPLGAAGVYLRRKSGF